MLQGALKLAKEAAEFMQKQPDIAALPAAEPASESKPEVPAKATASSKPEVLAELDQSVENMRATSKWIITLLAAIAAAVLAGTQLTSFGKLPAPDRIEDNRLGVAWLTGAIALAAIGFVIWHATQVLTTGAAQLEDLVAHENDDSPHPEVVYAKKIGVLEGSYGGHPPETFAQFQEKRTRYLKESEAAAEELLQARIVAAQRPDSQTANSAVEVAALKADAVAAKRSSLSLRRRVLLAAMRAHLVGQAMKEATLPMVSGAVVSGISLGMFVWAINPPESSSDSPFVIPAHGYVRLSEDNQAQWRNELGDSCVKGLIYVMVLSVAEKEAEVVSVVGNGCGAARFTVSLDELYPGMRVVVPTQEASPNAGLAS